MKIQIRIFARVWFCSVNIPGLEKQTQPNRQTDGRTDGQVINKHLAEGM